MKTSDVMTLGAATVREGAPVGQAVRAMLDHRISALPVVDTNDQLRGLISEGDLIRCQGARFRLSELLAMESGDRAKALASIKVDDIMTRNPVTIGPDASVQEAIALMKSQAVKRLPVVSGDKVLGVLSQSDLLFALID